MAPTNSRKIEARSSPSKASFHSQYPTTTLSSKAAMQSMPSSESAVGTSIANSDGFMEYFVVDDYSPGRQFQAAGVRGLSLLNESGNMVAEQAAAAGQSSNAPMLQAGGKSDMIKYAANLDNNSIRLSKSGASFHAEISALLSGPMQQSGGKIESVEKSTHKPELEVIDLTTPPPESQAKLRRTIGYGYQAQTTAQLKESHLHRLPGELRNRIYRYVGLSSQRLNITTMDEPALTQAIPDLRDEMHSILFSENKLGVQVFCDDDNVSPHRMLPFTLATDIDLPQGIPGYGRIWLDTDSWVKHVDRRSVLIKHIDFRVYNTFGHKMLDFFVNVRQIEGGKHTAAGRLDVFGTRSYKAQVSDMGDLARAVTKRIGEREGFVGLTWDDAEEIAACFHSVRKAKTKFTKQRGKIILV